VWVQWTLDWPRARKEVPDRQTVYVLATRVGKHLSTWWWARKSRRRSAHVLERPRPEIRARGEDSIAERKVFTEAQFTDSRSLRKDLHGAWKDGREEGVSMEEKVVLGFWDLEGGGLV
jgi:hypothetical protein